MSAASELAEQSCVPCKGGVPPLGPAACARLLERLGGDWTVVDSHHLSKTYRFANFADALAFVNRVGERAGEQNHHPDVFLAWGKVRLDIWTHKIDGLTESDFVFAAKADAVLAGTIVRESEV